MTSDLYTRAQNLMTSAGGVFVRSWLNVIGKSQSAFPHLKIPLREFWLHSLKWKIWTDVQLDAPINRKTHRLWPSLSLS